MEDRVRVRWSTASETNNALFVVERSADGEHFEHVGTVPGGGTSYLLRSYVFDDPRPLSGVSYYRLRQIDTDGTGSVSHVVAVDRKNAEPISAWLDAEARLTISGAVGPGAWMIHDPLGRLIAEGTLTELVEQRIQLPELPNGALVLSIRSEQRSGSVVLCRGTRGGL
jgi:hypothetical protein